MASLYSHSECCVYVQISWIVDTGRLEMTRTGSGENEFVITGLEANTLYTMTVTAYTNNGQNRGMESAPGTGMTGAGGRKAYPSPPSPSPPSLSPTHTSLHLLTPSPPLPPCSICYINMFLTLPSSPLLPPSLHSVPTY